LSIHIDRLKLLEALKITPSKQVIAKQTLDPNASTVLLPATQYRFAIVLFHGDGDPEVKHTVTVNGVATELLGDSKQLRF
jgi:hypothetical protein